MKYWTLIFAFFLGLASAPALAAMPTFEIKDGVLDLRQWNPETTPLFKVSGQAEFYWQQFIITDGADPQKKQLIEFPGAWNLKSSLPYAGYGSIRFHVILPEERDLAVQWSWVWTAMEAYADGRLIHKKGRIGRDVDTAVPGKVESWLTHIIPSQREFDIVLQMSNFDLFLGGHVDNIIMGNHDAVIARHNRKQAVDTFLLGAIFIMAIYHATLFLLRRSDPSTLYFGLFCLMIGTHLTAGSGSSIIGMMLDLDFRGHIMVYNFSWMMSIPCFGLFTRSLFPDEFFPLVNRLLIGICACFLIFVGSTEVRTFIWSTQIYQFVAFLGIVYALYVIGMAAKHKRNGARTFLVAICVLFAGSINDMLMIRGLLNSIPLAAASLFLFIFVQSYLLSVRFSRAFTRAERSEAEVRKLAEDLKQQNDQISDLNENLEARVEEQTRDIRSIMEHTPIAIFAIEGPESTVHRDYSLRLEDMLEEKHLAGRPILPLLFSSSSLSTDEQDQVTQSLASMIGEDAMAFELNEQKLPRSFTKTSKIGKIQQFEAVWNPIVNDQNRIDKVLVALTDVTEVRHLESAARERAEELQTIGEILSIKDEVFQRFLRSCRNFNDQNRQLLDHADPALRDRELVKIVFMNMHTMKGGARTLRLRKLADLFHDLESYYSHLARQDHESWDLALMMRDIETIEQSLAEYEKIAVEKLGRKLGDGATVLLPIPAVNAGFRDLHQLALKKNLDSGLQELYGAMQDALYMPLSSLMLDIFKDVHSLAKDLEKPLPSVHFDVPYVLIRLQSEELLRNTFVHLLRNSLDHGIEPPTERSGKGKNKVGQIQLSGRIEAQSVVLWLEDDGRGLNLGRLQSIGEERGLLAPGATPSAATCAELIFNDGISTAKAVTVISGRGMGMAAVRRYLEEAGGSIRIELKPSNATQDRTAPFRLRIDIPIALFSSKLEVTPDLERSA